MEAAYILHQKGHRAILVEEKDCLGGQFICAGQAPHKEVLAQAARARGEQILRSGVEVRLGVRADAALLEELKPDEVVIAAGASPVKLSIPGIKGKMSTAMSRFSWDRLLSPGKWQSSAADW